MRIGETRMYNHNWGVHDWEGLGDINYKFPLETYDFIYHQCSRFGLKQPPDEFVAYVIDYTYHCVGHYNPFTFFDITDVALTDLWQKKTFEIEDLDGKLIEVDPEDTMTFKYQPGPEKETYDYVISHPGLDAIPFGIGDDIKEFISGEVTRSSLLDDLSPHVIQELRQMAGCMENINTYADLVAWAAFAWMVGPYGTCFRREMNYIFDTCYEYGECIIHQGCIYSPNQYRMIDRLPKSCVMCGLDAWCVEMVYIDGVARYMCEHHVNLKPLSKVHCGTKVCRHTECPHHPMKDSGIKQIDFLRMIHGHQQNMVEWNGHGRTKAIAAS